MSDSETSIMMPHKCAMDEAEEMPSSCVPRIARAHSRRRKGYFSTMIACALLFVASPRAAFGFAPEISSALRSCPPGAFRREEITCSSHSPKQTNAAFMPSPSNPSPQRKSNLSNQHMSSMAVEAPPASASKLSDFSQRMRKLVVKRTDRSREAKVGGQNGRPSNVKVVHTLEDYKAVVGQEKEKIVVVRFYATWCKACRAMAPVFYRLASVYKDIAFVEVPVTDKNANLHQGLNVPSLPYGHIYHPKAGLVDELKINRKYFAKFAKTVHSYASSACELVDGETANPFAHLDEEVKN